MKLSVIIPNYNKKNYIEACIRSVISQTFSVTEIIVVDDASTDGSQKVIEGLAARYQIIKPYLLPKNRGVSFARNFGVCQAEGDYVTMLDSDDFYYSNNKLEKEMHSLFDLQCQNIKNPISYSRIIKVDSNGVPLKMTDSIFYTMEGNILLDLLSGKQCVNLPRDYCISRAFFQHCGGYNEKLSFYEDLDLLIRLARDGYFVCTEVIGTAYRNVPEGLSKKTVSEHKKVVNDITFKYIKELPSLQKIICICEWCLNRGKTKIKNGKRKLIGKNG